MDPHQIDAEMRRAQAEFHQLITSASPDDLRRLSDGTRWTNRQLLFHMVLGYGVVRTLLPGVRALGRLGHSRGFAEHQQVDDRGWRRRPRSGRRPRARTAVSDSSAV